MNTEVEDFGVPEDLGPPRGMKSSRKAFSSPGLRIGIALLVLLIVGVALVALWSGGQQPTLQSTVAPTAPVKDIPGTNAPQAYAQAVKTKNSQRLQEALETGGSVIPTPVAQPQLPKEDAGEKTVEIDPVAAFQQAVAPPPPPVVPATIQPAQQSTFQQYQPTVDVNNLTSAMQQQMQSLIAGWTPQPAVVMQLGGATDLESLTSSSAGGGSGAGGAMIGGLTEEKDTGPRVLIPAGERVYAQLETEANSDIPSPVIARILSGPLAGGRALGTFQSTGDYLVMEFSMISRGDKEFSIQGVAMDPETQLTGLVTDSDQRYLQRIALPGAAAFIRGFARAYADPGSSTTVGNQFAVQDRRKQTREEQIAQGIEETAEVASSIFQEEASQIEPLVIVKSGTPIAILFLSSVREEIPE